MITFRHVPVVKALTPYALGSLFGYNFCIETEPLSLILLSLPLWLGSFLLYRFQGGRSYTYCWCFSLLIQMIFFLAGLGTGAIDQPVDPGLPSDVHLVISGSVREEAVLQNERLVFALDLRMARSDDSTFQVNTLVKAYMPISSGSPCPEVGEHWIFCGRLIPVMNAGNPGEVDYASILRRKNCWYRFYCDTTTGLNRKVGEAKRIIPGPGEIRRALSGKWKGKPETIALLKAVCLGDRSGLSEDLRQSYSMAGGMHVLAVSGLHVGLIWWVLHKLFYFTVLLGRREIYRTVLITLILWTFAYATGFSSSVSRSVCMFTFYSLSRLINQKGHSVNAILVSMFFLILIHPGRLLDVGFQLSYAAILSIVTLHPFFMKIWRPRNRMIRWCWEATGLSLAAQIGTLPLVVFYFHQVPVYALLTNLFAIPLLTCIITIFVVSLPLAFFGFGAGFANTLLAMAAGAMNFLMELIASFPVSVVGQLHADGFTTAMLMILLALLILFLNSSERGPLYLSVFVICMMGVWEAGLRVNRLKSTEVRISHFRGGSLLSIREGEVIDHYILSDDPKTVVYMDRYLNQAWGKRCYEVSVIRLDEKARGQQDRCGITCAISLKADIWLVGNSRIRGLVLAASPGEEARETLSGLNSDFLLISGEPFLKQEDILPISRNLVVDGSCRSWYSAKLRNTGLSFYNTASQGAFVIHY